MLLGCGEEFAKRVFEQEQEPLSMTADEAHLGVVAAIKAAIENQPDYCGYPVRLGLHCDKSSWCCSSPNSVSMDFDLTHFLGYVQIHSLCPLIVHYMFS